MGRSKPVKILKNKSSKQRIKRLHKLGYETKTVKRNGYDVIMKRKIRR